MKQELAKYAWPGNVRQLKQVLNSLNAYFRKRPLGVMHLRAIFLLEGVETEFPGSKTKKEHPAVQLEALQRFRHLRAIQEIVRSTFMLVRPVFRQEEGGNTLLDPMFCWNSG